MQILPTITTITPGKWRDKIAEVKKLKLKEVALFLTCLDQEQRKTLYALLKETSVKKVPFVHIRSDMELWELNYLANTYQTKAFNTHTKREHASLYDYGKYKKVVFIENTYGSFDEEEIKEFGGICLDLSHLENERLLNPKIYLTNIAMLKKHPPSCSHVAAIRTKTFIDENSRIKYSTHHLTSLSELDYLKRYPLAYFGSIAAIELENSIEEQLKVKEYLSALIKNKV